MKNYLRKVRLWLLTIVVLSLLLMGGFWINPPAQAAIRQLEESPGQIVYQSRHALQDQHGNQWQTIAFNRVRADGKHSFYLRLVTFPGGAEIDRSQPLTLTTSLGKSYTAADASQQIFTDEFTPEPNVGQYDLQAIVSELELEIPLQLQLPVLSNESNPDGADIKLSISPDMIQEWQTVATYGIESASESAKISVSLGLNAI
jgi:hypothetical protein